MSLTVHLALVFHVFIAVAVMVMVCGRRRSAPKHMQKRPLYARDSIATFCCVLATSLICTDEVFRDVTTTYVYTYTPVLSGHT